MVETLSRYEGYELSDFRTARCQLNMEVAVCTARREVLKQEYILLIISNNNIQMETLIPSESWRSITSRTFSIDKAPKDGTMILVFSPEEEKPFIAWWHKEEKVWIRESSNTIVKSDELIAYQEIPTNPYYKK